MKKVFSTIDELYTAQGSGQITAREILNGRAHVFGEWQEIELSPELKEQVIESIVSLVGGRNETKNHIRNVLKYYGKSPRHYTMDRIFIVKYGDNPAHLWYCAGQDHTYEIGQLRKYLKNL